MHTVKLNVFQSCISLGLRLFHIVAQTHHTQYAAAIRYHTFILQAGSGLEDFADLMQEARARAPLGRLVTLDEVGALASFLVSPAASGMTGQTLYVDAGDHATR